MKSITRSFALRFIRILTPIAAVGACAIQTSVLHAQGYTQKYLVSSIPGLADQTDPDLLNAWGLVTLPGGQLIVADNHSNLATIYRRDGTRQPFAIAVDEAPTGLVWNPSAREFPIGSKRHRNGSVLLFCSEAGTILGWNPAVNAGSAVVAVDNSGSEAVYKGMTLAQWRGHAYLYAADFHNGKVDMYDSGFKWLRSFTDPGVDAGFAPFNVENIDGRLFVAFAKQLGPDNEDDEAGPGNGFIDVFDLQGRLLHRFASHGSLDSPWGMARAPGSFGQFGGALLVGNFGDGAISAFNPVTGEFLGRLTDSSGQVMLIPGLWALRFSSESGDGRDRDQDDYRRSSRSPTLFFTGGPHDEEDGLLGVIHPN
jgi:uncharacterized protein (TIGR03118 family)